MYPKIIHQSWYDCPIWTDKRLALMKKNLKWFDYAPQSSDIFRAFSIPTSDVRVVFLGLSPYQKVAKDGTLYATGLAMGTPGFETETLKCLRDGLWHDYKDLRSEDLDLTLEHWHNQGVMLLNVALTVLKNKDAVSHLHRKEYDRGIRWSGWEWFTKMLIEYMSEQLNGIVFVFVGAVASKYKELIDTSKHYTITATHPAAKYHWQRQNSGKVPVNRDFSKQQVFKKIDELTMFVNKTKIKWYE